MDTNLWPMTRDRARPGSHAHVYGILDHNIAGHSVLDREIAVDRNARGGILRLVGLLRSRAGLLLLVAAEIQGPDHLKQSVAAGVVHGLLRRLTAQVDAAIVPSVLQSSAIALDLQPGGVANDLETAGIVDYPYPVAVANDAQIPRVVLDAILLVVAHQILAGIDRGFRERGGGIPLGLVAAGGFTLRLLACGALVIVVRIVRIAGRIGLYHTNAHFGVNYLRFCLLLLFLSAANHSQKSPSLLRFSVFS